LEQSKPISTFKHLGSRKYSFQKLNWFSQGNNMLDAAASNIDDIFRRDTYISSTQLVGLFGTKWALLLLKTMIFRISSFQKLTQFLVGD
jgi:hypothetical protein